MLAVLGRRVDVGGGVGVADREAADLGEVGVVGRAADQRLLGSSAPAPVWAPCRGTRSPRATPCPASSSWTPATTPASAKSPLRRAASSTANPLRPDHTGKWTAVRISSSPDQRRPGAEEEVGGLDGAGAARTGDLEVGVEREGHRRQLRRRVGVGDRPADRAAVADLEVSDERERLGQQGHRLTDGGVVLDGALGRHGLDRDRAVGARRRPRSSSTRFRSTMCSNRVRRSAEHGDQALTTRKQLRLVTVLGEQRGDVTRATRARGTRTARASSATPQDSQAART